LGGPGVQRVYARAGKFLLACLILIGFAAIASLGTSLSMSLGSAPGAVSVRPAAPTPAEVVASRFPSSDVSAAVMPTSYATASVLPVEQWEMFSPRASDSRVTAYAALPATAEVAEPLGAQPAQSLAAKAAAPKPEPAKAQPANTAPRRVASRPSGVLNDAQIANIKQRLNLTADQEQMWPAVETALRKIAYTKGAMSPQVHTAQSSSERMAYIDPGSAEVQQLKYAALPLIMRLNDDQRREVKMMAHVMGLEGMASQF
jgi:hypothetical protein